MKKLFICAAFAFTAMLAKAETNLIKVETVTTEKTTESEKLHPNEWSYSVTCENGFVAVGCCWATAQAAFNAALAIMAANC